MELKLQDCLDVHSALKQLDAQIGENGQIIKGAPIFSAKFSMVMADLEIELEPKIKALMKVRNDLFTKYGEFSPDHKAYLIKKENEELFSKDTLTILEESVEINFKPIAQDVFDGVTVSKEFMKLIKSVRVQLL